MGIDTLGVMLGHVPLNEIVTSVRSALPGASVSSRQLTGPNVWIIEVIQNDGGCLAVTAYLNSHAAEDYPELNIAESTMLLVEYGPDSSRLIEAVIQSRGGWLKRADGEGWGLAPPLKRPLL